MESEQLVRSTSPVILQEQHPQSHVLQYYRWKAGNSLVARYIITTHSGSKCVCLLLSLLHLIKMSPNS